MQWYAWLRLSNFINQLQVRDDGIPPVRIEEDFWRGNVHLTTTEGTGEFVLHLRDVEERCTAVGREFDHQVHIAFGRQLVSGR